jgi:biotin carboxylase
MPGTNATLPTLLVIHDLPNSASPLRVLLAARGLCQVTFLASLADPEVAAELADARQAARVVDTSGLDDDALVRLAMAEAPDGVLTFSERRLRQTATLASRLRLPYHAERTAAVLTDKLTQRRLMTARGVQTTRSALVRGPGDVAAALARAGVPAVLKPRHGAGSVDTCLVTSAAECRRRLAEFTDGRTARDFVLEELLVGDPSVAGPAWGDYVSVESVVEDGVVCPIAVTGKMPLQPPFREGGQFSPADLPDGVAERARKLAADALRALGVRHGLSHTEIKLTPDGPRIIEVNGRLGGLVADVVLRASGYDLVVAALRMALGRPLDTPPRWDRGVAYQYLLLPPGDDAAAGPRALLDELAEVPGVDLVDVQLSDNWRPDWRAGSLAWAGVVYGTAGDHAALRGTIAEIRSRMDVFWYGAARGDRRLP